MHQNASRLAPKHTAFSTKTQRYLLQNADRFAAKYTLLTMFYGLNSK